MGVRLAWAERDVGEGAPMRMRDGYDPLEPCTCWEPPNRRLYRRSLRRAAH